MHPPSRSGTRPRLLAALLHAAEERQLGELGDDCELSVCRSRLALRTALVEQAHDTLLLPVADPSGVPVMPLVGRARGYVRRIAVFVRLADIDSPRQLPLLARAGVGTFLFERDGPLAVQLRDRLLGVAPNVDPKIALARLGADGLPEADVLATVIEQAERRLAPGAIAALLHTSERALNRRAARAGLRSLGELRTLGALIRHAVLLDEGSLVSPGSDARWMRTALRRFTGTSWRAFETASSDARWSLLRAALRRPAQEER